MVGGDRPKATIEVDGRLWLAKMQARNDMPALPAKEFVCMRLAGECDISIPEVRLETVADAPVSLLASGRGTDPTLRKKSANYGVA